VKALGGNDLIYHKPVTSETASLDLSSGKQIRRKAKNRRALMDADFGSSEFAELKLHRSVPKVRAYLSQFALEFLDSYNQLMVSVKDALNRKKNQDNDETYYLWAAAFFMEYNRHAKPDVSLVSTTYNAESLHYFNTQILEYIDKIKMEKKNYLPWSRRLHYALKAYRELICNLAFMSGSTDPEYRDITKKIKLTAFYEEDYRELLAILFREFNPVKMSRRYLIDLVVTNHVFLKMLKSYCDSSDAVIAVKVKARKGSKKKGRTKKQIERDTKRWNDMDQELQDCLTGIYNLPTAEDDEDVLPMESTVEFDPELQRIAIAKRIKRLLFEEKVTTAVALLRSAREAFADDPEKRFGSPDCAPEDEMMALKDIYDSDFPDHEEEDNDHGAGDGATERRVEKTMQFTDMFRKYCVPRVLQAHITLLKDFDKNSVITNHAVIKYLHRLAHDYELVGMLFQASIFRILQRILSKPVIDEWSKELNDFAKYVVREFVKVFPKNQYLLVEMLFWKNAREAKSVVEGYDEAVMPTAADDDDEDVHMAMPPISDDEEDENKSGSKSPDLGADFFDAATPPLPESDDEDAGKKTDDGAERRNSGSKSPELGEDFFNVATPPLPDDEPEVEDGDTAPEVTSTETDKDADEAAASPTPASDDESPIPNEASNDMVAGAADSDDEEEITVRRTKRAIIEDSDSD
jgi:timeless